MARKLYALALEKCAPESADSPMMQEVLLGGHLYLMTLKVMDNPSFIACENACLLGMSYSPPPSPQYVIPGQCNSCHHPLLGFTIVFEMCMCSNPYLLDSWPGCSFFLLPPSVGKLFQSRYHLFDALLVSFYLKSHT